MNGDGLWWCEWAWLGADDATPDVLLHVADRRFTRVLSGVRSADVPASARRLGGLTLPGLVNAHSHAFHRGLRGRTHGGPGSFWTWREQMYELASRLDPDRYHALARATFAEMALAGITAVGEFHYLHHNVDGGRYVDANAMGKAVLAAAADAGIRIALLDTCYLAGGIGLPLEAAQQRFGDGTAAAWAERVTALERDIRPAGPVGWGAARLGAAVHSVRAVPEDQLETVGAWASARRAPLHVHLSEQPAENDACLAAYGCTPTELLDRRGLLGSATVAVHATHVTTGDISRLGTTGTAVCLCPTTERDLADGVGPAPALSAAGTPLSVGTDSHAVIDLFEEARAIELDSRLVTGQRGHHPPAALLAAATIGGGQALGWDDSGRLAPGYLADFTTIRLDSARLAGSVNPNGRDAAAAVVFAATASDVDTVVVGGVPVVSGGCHLRVGDVGAALSSALREAWGH
jgi:formiminoglutamate deiminase